MIESLTVEQEQLMEEIAGSYEKMVLGGDDSFDFQKIESSMDFIYRLAELTPPQKIIICTSPLDMALKANLKSGETFDCLGCGYDAGWTAFYDYIQKIGVDYDCDFASWKTFITETGVYATVLCKETAFCCVRPCEVHRNANYDLHNSNGMAIKWRDGYGEYFLNGVSVEEYLVMTPAEKLDPHVLLKEKNTEVRREIVRKIGIEMVCLKLNASVLDTYTVDINGHEVNYELLNLDIGDGRQRPYLKMKNPSINTYHLEGVPPQIKTVKEALTWRNGTPKSPYVIS